MLKKYLKALKYKYYQEKYKKNNIILKNNVLFNSNTIFDKNIKINSNVNLINTKISIGTYVGNNCVLNNCLIGKFCSIADGVKIIQGRHPVSKFVSIHPAFFSNNKQAGFSFNEETIYEEFKYIIPEKKISCIIENDVWIGCNALIMEGIKIGTGAIIGAGAIVTKDIPPYAIVVGVPAKIIRYRFKQDEINILLENKWWDRDFEWLKRNREYFYDIDKYKLLLNK